MKRYIIERDIPGVGDRVMYAIRRPSGDHATLPQRYWEFGLTVRSARPSALTRTTCSASVAGATMTAR